jgi:ABC-type multidrug transport system ATPase subunit
MSDTPLLQLQNITKTFGSVQALDDVDFEVRAGEVMALVGDNGAGKSTLIKCVTGIHPIDDGDVYFSVEAYPHYGQLSGQRPEELIAGSRVEPGEGKRAPLDFALGRCGLPRS